MPPESGGTRTISLAFVPLDPDATMRPLNEMLEYDWKGVDSVVALMRELRVFVVGLRSLSDVELFIERVEPRMPHLQAAGKLRYAIWNESSATGRNRVWSWRTYEPDAVKQGGS